MATTINVLCYRSKTLKNGEHPLMLCICKDRARKYTSLNLSVKAEHWNFDKNEPKPNCPNREHICLLIASKKAEYEKEAIKLKSEGRDFTADGLHEKIQSPTITRTVADIFNEYIEHLRQEKRTGYMKSVVDLFDSFNFEKDIQLLQTLTQTRLTETQFAQIVGRMRLYQALPSYQQRKVPKLLITDSQINNVCRDYYSNPNFGAKDNTISMFDFHNLLTEANKSSYIDSYVQRGINATEVTVGICKALQGDSEYSWFLG